MRRRQLAQEGRLPRGRPAVVAGGIDCLGKKRGRGVVTGLRERGGVRLVCHPQG
jgi:hypothetical protein